MNTRHLTGSPTTTLPAAFTAPDHVISPPGERRREKASPAPPPIPMPVRVRWDAFRSEVLPLLVVGLVVFMVFLLWHQYVRPIQPGVSPAAVAVDQASPGAPDPDP